MIQKDDVFLWSSEERIYTAGDSSHEAHLVLEGSVTLFTPDGLELNRIGQNEVFGEGSLMLDENRSVTAVAGVGGAKTKMIPKDYFLNLTAREPLLAALIRKLEYRLMDSNRQSDDLANELEKLAEKLEKHFATLESASADRDEIMSGLNIVKKKVQRTHPVDQTD